MSAKVFNLPCAPNLVEALTAAIRGYVAIQYPPGVSDCALAAREALLTVAENIETGCQSATTVTLSRRLRTMLKIAVNFYCDQRSEGEAREMARDAMLAALQGEQVTDELIAPLLNRQIHQ
ncbi:MAG: hypothetical protein R3354_02110 [Thiohalomonadales bacterium]|nr:hypothetical protein [Thiohalomonadales bacterium]